MVSRKNFKNYPTILRLPNVHIFAFVNKPCLLVLHWPKDMFFVFSLLLHRNWLWLFIFLILFWGVNSGNLYFIKTIFYNHCLWMFHRLLLFIWKLHVYHYYCSPWLDLTFSAPTSIILPGLFLVKHQCANPLHLTLFGCSLDLYTLSPGFFPQQFRQEEDIPMVLCCFFQIIPLIFCTLLDLLFWVLCTQSSLLNFYIFIVLKILMSGSLPPMVPLPWV